MNKWIEVGPVEAFPKNGGACVLLEGTQVAVFNFSGEEWYAVENKCPHEKQEVISRGLLGDHCGEPKIACPMHKNAFSLKDGRHLGGNTEWKLKTFPVQVKDGCVHLGLES